MSSPFQLFSWDRPFLPEVAALVDRLTDGQPGTAVIVVPHNRPRRYLAELYRERAMAEGRVGLLPRVLTVQELQVLLRGYCAKPAVYSATALDRVALLHHCVQALGEEDSQLCARFAGMDIARFLPWGVRLGAIFEECFTQNIEAADMAYTEGEVSALAAVLLNALGRLQQAYVRSLREKQWTTPGLDAFTVVQALRQNAEGLVDDGACSLLPPLICPQGGERVVLLAGFAVLSGAEEVMLRALWQEGAHVCLHTDTALQEGQGHWACEEHGHWIKRWKASTVVAAEAVGNIPQIHFIEGYDAHSQLASLSALLRKDGENDGVMPPSTQNDGVMPPSTAIVLADSSLLLPTLHSLPDKGVNISMGYPLERTPLCRLLESLLHLHANRQEDGRYHWRSLRHALRHPYLRMLAVQEDEGSLSLRPVLQAMEALLREGSRFVDAQELLHTTLTALEAAPALAALAHRVCECLLDNFVMARSPDTMARAVAQLCALLVDCGQHTWERYPLDAESMYRLMHDVVPALRGSVLAHTEFPAPVLHSLLRQAIQSGRVPFEADPIAGMQVLGMLETRLLHFERVIVLDATDDHIPGSPAQDPLLPDSLRLILGLPDARRRDRTAAHTLYRLMNSAKDVYFYWQEGVQRSALFEGKKSRSRFVDACIWQEEQRRGTLLKVGEEPLQVTPCIVRPMPRERRSLVKTPALRARMAIVMGQGLSPTRLDAYITCPLRFALEHVCRIKALQEVNEGDDPAAVGELVHKVLQQSYTPFVGKDLHVGDITADMLRQNFLHALEQSGLRQQLPPDSYCMLELAGPLRLGRYLENQPPMTHIVALEHSIQAPLLCGETRHVLRGTLDRLDKREGQIVVLDYKTGTVATPRPTLWTDTGFWQALRCFSPGQEEDPLLLLKNHMPSVQLPCYMYLAAHANLSSAPVGDAAWVRLREDGKEIALFGQNFDAEIQQESVENSIPTLLRFILQHMEFTDEFMPIEGAHCQWCTHMPLCLK